MEDKLHERMFADDDVRDLLNTLTLTQLFTELGEAEEYVTYAKAAPRPDGEPWWKPGDERPALANDDPAVMQALARCAANRIRLDGAPRSLFGDIHPSECGWCGYPLDELLKSCAWNVARSGYIQSHVFVWTDKEKKHSYARAGGDTGYRNKVHRAFWELSPKERERRIEAAAGRADLIEKEGRLAALDKESTDD